MAISEKDITICGHGSGRPSTKNMYSYLNARYRMIAKNGKHKGVVKVMRLKKMTDAKRKEFVNTYKTIIGRNYYSQGKRSYVYSKYKDGKYYSDCSSSGMATLRKIGFNISLLNTAGIYNSSLFEEVPVKIKNGHITNPEILKVADAILFVGSDPSRPLQIGHVEYVYKMPTTTTKIDTVKEVQTWVNSNYGLKIAVDNKYGKQTNTALIKALQTELNKTYGCKLKVDGVLGSKTKAAIRVLKKGSKNDVVKVLQALLVCHGYSDAYVDGDYGNGTEKAVIDYKTKKGLTPNGNVGEKTFGKLCA